MILPDNEPLTLLDIAKFAGLAILLAAGGFVGLAALMIYL